MLEQVMGLGYLTLAGGVYVWVWKSKSPEKAKMAAKSGGKAFGNVAVTLLSVFAIVGFLNVFVPTSFIRDALGSAGGALSLLTGTAIGSAAAGPPVAAYPIAQQLLDAGAWAPAIAAFIVSWTLVGFLSLPFEGQMFGTKFAVWRNVLSFGLAMVVGLIVGWVL